MAEINKPTKILIKGQSGPDSVFNQDDFGLLIKFYMGDDAYEYYKVVLESISKESKDTD